jgi:hypothetical protein
MKSPAHQEHFRSVLIRLPKAQVLNPSYYVQWGSQFFDISNSINYENSTKFTIASYSISRLMKNRRQKISLDCPFEKTALPE